MAKAKTRSDSKSVTDMDKLDEKFDEKFNEKFELLASKECINELKQLIVNQNKKIDKLNDTITAQDKKIKDLEKTVTSHESMINILNGRIAVLSSAVDYLKTSSEQQEQYSRRNCLRINGVEKAQNETADDCLEKVQNICNDLGVEIPPESIERAHRVGKERKAIIVKFTSFKHRTMVYRKRNKNGPVKIHLDLTKPRLKLLDEAKELVTEDCKVNFAFADINCNTVARMKDGSYKFFQNIDDFTKLLF